METIITIQKGEKIEMAINIKEYVGTGNITVVNETENKKQKKKETKPSSKNANSKKTGKKG